MNTAKLMLLAAAAALLSSCAAGIKLEGVKSVDGDKVACGQDKVIWKSETTDTEAAKCLVYVRSEGAEGCTPGFLKPAGPGAWVPVGTNAVPGETYRVTAERVSKLQFECKGSGSRTCSYEIVKVVCHAKEGDVTDARTENVASRDKVECSKSKVVWTPDTGASSCNVTFKLSAAPTCPALLTTSHPASKQLSLRADRNSSKLLTVVNVKEMKLECASEQASTDTCSFAKLTTECRKK